VCVCADRETDGLLMFRRGGLPRRVVLWAVGAKGKKRWEEVSTVSPDRLRGERNRPARTRSPSALVYFCFFSFFFLFLSLSANPPSFHSFLSDLAKALSPQEQVVGLWQAASSVREQEMAKRGERVSV